MNDSLVLGFVLIAVCITVWLWIAVAVGSAAKAKGRSRGLWVVLALLPLGMIVAPLWLKTLSAKGRPTSRLQVVGRIALASIIVLFVLVPSFLGSDFKVRQQAWEKFGYEFVSVSVHERKMTVGQLAECIDLTRELSRLHHAESQDTGVTPEGARISATKQFEVVLGKHRDMACGTRTFEFEDLKKALKQLDQKERENVESDASVVGGHEDGKPINASLDNRRLRLIEALVKSYNLTLPVMFDESVRWDRMASAGDSVLVNYFTIVTFFSADVEQTDLSKYLRPKIVRRFCHEQLSVLPPGEILQLGVSIESRFQGKDGGEIGSFTITKADCK